MCANIELMWADLLIWICKFTWIKLKQKTTHKCENSTLSSRIIGCLDGYTMCADFVVSLAIPSLFDRTFFSFSYMSPFTQCSLSHYPCRPHSFHCYSCSFSFRHLSISWSRPHAVFLAVSITLWLVGLFLWFSKCAQNCKTKAQLKIGNCRVHRIIQEIKSWANAMQNWIYALCTD